MTGADPAKAGRQPDGRFSKGSNHNPRGRALGSRHKASLAVEALLNGEAEAITRTCVEKAIQGDMTAIKVCLDRIAPARRERCVTFALPRIETGSDILIATQALARAVSGGELAPGEGAAISTLLGNAARAVELVELDARLKRLEEALVEKGNLS